METVSCGVFLKMTKKGSKLFSLSTLPHLLFVCTWNEGTRTQNAVLLHKLSLYEKKCYNGNYQFIASLL